LTHKGVNLDRFGVGFPPRVIFLGREADGTGIIECGAVAEGGGTDGAPQALENIFRLVTLRATWRDAREEGGDRLLPCKPDKLQRGRHRFQVIDRGAAGDQNEVGGFRGG
jgi:hypothetical protein